MKTIKKVAVSTLPDTEGAIIDSFNTSDDKHTNAPSLNAVQTYCKLNSDFAVLTGQASFPPNNKVYLIEYPTGFDKDNCVIVSFMMNNAIKLSEGEYIIRLRDTAIRLELYDTSTQTSIEDYKIVLMKI